RLQAYEAAGADVLYAPALKTLDEVRLVSASIGKPLNVLGTPFAGCSVEDLGDAGAKRVSIGGALARLIAGVVIETATALRDRGDLSWVAKAVSSSEVERLFAQWTDTHGE
ncbi:MAG: isocitrate lyase/phosphoenolpyruvate mutase family protein, partial [Gammaproteobacteria bacterium]|nr:isocitrate lyase/phosphoenolpyruvate mutase family protein [Gammaproteobacteria bacterium]